MIARKSCKPFLSVLASAVLLCATLLAAGPASAQQFDPPEDTSFPDIFASPDTVAKETVGRRKLEALAQLTHTDIEIEHLRRMAATLREKKIKTPSGLWSLTLLYSGLNDATIQQYWHPMAFAEFEKRFATAITANPNDPFLYILRAQVLYAQAIAAMDPATAPEGTPEAQGEAIEARVSAFMNYLDEIHDKASSDPGWYRLALSARSSWCIALEDRWAILTEAMEKFPDFHQLYFEVVQAAHRCDRVTRNITAYKVVDMAAQKLGAVQGDALYARTMWYMSQLDNSEHIFATDLVDWHRMRRGIDHILAQHGDTWNVNHFAKFACTGGDKTVALRLLPKVVQNPLQHVWGNPGRFGACWQWSRHPDTPDRYTVRRAPRSAL